MIFQREVGWYTLAWVFALTIVLGLVVFVVAVVQSEERQRVKREESEQALAAQPKFVTRCPAGFIVHDGSYGYGNKPICLPGVMPMMERQP